MSDSLRVEHLWKSFGDKTVLRDLSIEFSPTGLYWIKGVSGSGKTTLLRIIAGFLKPDRGNVVGGGMKNCSVSFQEYRLFPTLTAIENVRYALPPGTDEKRAREQLNVLLPHTEDQLLYPHEMSGGMQQRVSVARALAVDRPILLLDEPTKELDEIWRKVVFDLIQKESLKRLVIVVSHDEDVVGAIADHVIEL